MRKTADPQERIGGRAKIPEARRLRRRGRSDPSAA
jgi:hypothetical protein